MSRMFLLFNHTLSPIQVADATDNHGVQEFVSLPADLHAQFRQVDPATSVLGLAGEVVGFLEESGIDEEDLVLLQGEFRLSFAVATFLLSKGIKVVVATSRRDSVESVVDGKTVKKAVFVHLGFMPYEVL